MGGKKMKKYELTKEKKEFFGKTLFRIKALRDGKFFSKGELGGFIEKEANLSQSGDAWVSDDAWVSGDARVSGDAWVSDDALVSGDACVSDDAWVSADAWLYGNARVSGKLKLKVDLCSRFNFKSDWQVKLWHKLENEFEQECKKKREEAKEK